MYTVEGLRSAWELVAEGGHLSLCFSVFAGPWIADRLHWTLEEATGVEPVVIAHGMNYGFTYLVPKPPASLDLSSVADMPLARPTTPEAGVRVTTDDWPFLYVKPYHFPLGYVTLLALVLLTGSFAIRATFRTAEGRRGVDWPMFCMGAAFLLLETRGVTNLSLLFGSTWVVNTCVFAGILAMAQKVANLLVDRFRPVRPGPWFVPLLLAVCVVLVFYVGLLNETGLWLRGSAGGLINALPIGFAGVVVSILLVRSRQPAMALGSNLLGALVGGCLEYTSMWFGLRTMTALVLMFYLLALLILRRQDAARAASIS